MSNYEFHHLTHHADELVDVKYFDDRVDPWKNWVFIFHARPKSNVATSFTVTDQTDENGVQSRKTEQRLSVDYKGTHTHWTFANDKFAAKAERKDLLKESEWHVDAELSGEFKPAKDEWKVTGQIHGHTPLFNKIRGFGKLNVEHNQKGETLIKKGFNFARDDKYHLGWFIESDVKTTKRLWGQIAFTPEAGKVGFLRADLQKHFVSAGCAVKVNDLNATHAFEVSYDASEGAKGFRGFPVVFRTGAHYKLGETSHVKSAIHFGEHWGEHLKVEHKVDKNWTVEAHQDFCSKKLGSKAGPYNLGFKVHYKL